ncbi:hypothetical protein WOLCODRAFT_165380 [Wolfiporia cocos MD-104 SS10]|uniref:Uncharacterized protein n=1 Tax=Wolfiporia cocos (strain MD-104) TaxID=742152 RepID=A0A2H3K6R8_WOLCO|nr:hypothetical protein WOLCODRAFT_165380 [Wolfiporia cocos MD-104 SS10]
MASRESQEASTNIFAHEWKTTHPDGRTDEFDKAFSALLKEQLQVYTAAANELNSSDLYKYVTCRPRGGDARVKSSMFPIDLSPSGTGVDELYAAIDTDLVEITWECVASWHNDTDAEQSCEQTYVAEWFRITSGNHEQAQNIGLGDYFRGFSFTADHQWKILESIGVPGMPLKTVRVTVPARSTLFFYRRVYTFKSSMFFIASEYGESWNIESGVGDSSIAKKDFTVQITSQDYAMVKQVLDGTKTGTINVDTVARLNVEDKQQTSKHDDLSIRMKVTLRKIGI